MTASCELRHQPLMAPASPASELVLLQVSNVWYEAGAGIVNVVAMPVKGARRGGVVGAVEGAARGVAELNRRPVHGLELTAQALHRMATARRGEGGGGEGGGEA